MPSEPQSDGTIVGTMQSPRYLAAVIDTFLAFIVAMFAAVAVDALVSASESTFDVERRLGEVREPLAAATFCLAFVLYYFASEGLFAATPAKLFFGLRVVDSRGRRCGWTVALARTLLRFIEVNPLLLGGLPAALVIVVSPSNQRLGDMLGSSYVVLEGERLAETGEPDSKPEECSACGEALSMQSGTCPVCGLARNRQSIET